MFSLLALPPSGLLCQLGHLLWGLECGQVGINSNRSQSGLIDYAADPPEHQFHTTLCLLMVLKPVSGSSIIVYIFPFIKIYGRLSVQILA